MQPTPRRLVSLAAGLLVAAAVFAGIAQPSPEHCARCYEKLKQDNRDCQSLRGQDWTICREAAASAYRTCSKGC